MKKRLLVFHPAIAPYRIDFFNDLSNAFEAKICLQMKNLLNQKFDYDSIEAQFKFRPTYLKKIGMLCGRVVCKGVWKELTDYNADIVVVSEFGLEAITAIIHRAVFKKKYKIISICDDSYNMIAENNDFSRVHRFLRKKISIRLNDLILVEPKVVEWYKSNYKKGFFFPIIANDSLVTEKYRKALPMSQNYVKQYTLAGKKLFLFVGRLVNLKNIDFLIKSFDCSKIENKVLVIVGDGEERDHLEKVARDSKSEIIFTGRLEGEQLYAWYNLAGCFVLPSYQEPFGAVTNEALIGGAKCLISKNAGSNCLIKPGMNGDIINPFDVMDCINKMEHIAGSISAVPEKVVTRQSLMPFLYSDMIRNLIRFMEAM